jgi:hypothetical protein
MAASTDESYPRFQQAHPRNRDTDWAMVGRYAEQAEPSAAAAQVNIFIKTDREIDNVVVPGTGFVVSKKLRAALEPVAGGPVVFLPIHVNGEPFWILRVNNVVDALDAERSEIRYSVQGVLRAIEKPVWHGEVLHDPMIFEVPQRRHMIWATTAVVRAYQRSGCNGLSFSARGEVM